MKKSSLPVLAVALFVFAAYALPQVRPISISYLSGMISPYLQFAEADDTARSQMHVRVRGDLRKKMTPAIPSGAFTPGNLVIYRVGTGASSLSAAATAVFLDEYTTAGVLVQSIPMPTATSGSQCALTASGSATTEGLLSRSADGRYIVLAGYDATPGTSSIVSSFSSTRNRVIARVDAAGAVDTSTALTDAISGGSPRGAASTNGTDLWISGNSDGGGIRYATFGATTSTPLNTATVTNLRGVGIFGGQLYISAQSGSFRLAAVGSGAPSTTGQSITNLPGFPDGSGSPYSFVFADLSPSVPGVDTVYVADDSSLMNGGGARKFSLVSGSWTLNGTIGLVGTRGLTGVISGSSVALFATAAGNTLQSATDTSGYNAAPNGTFSLLATAASNTAFRGVALAPEAPAEPEINVSPGVRDFGNQVVNTTSSPLSVTVENTGTADLVLGTPAFLDGSQFAVVTDPNGTVLGPTETTTIEFTFTPTSVGTKNDTVTITSNAPGPAPAIALTGTGIAAANLSADPTSVNMGDATVTGAAANSSIMITNNGASVEITDLAVTGTNAADFSATAVGGLPAVLANGESLTVNLSFSPSASGSREATVGVTSTPGSTLTVPLTGNGIDPPRTRIVDRLDDSSSADECIDAITNDCSLRRAIETSADGDTVTFDPGLFSLPEGASLVAAPQTIVLNGSEIQINTDIAINGPGVDQLTIDAGAIPHRIFLVNNSTVEITDVSLTGGDSVEGGAISASGALTVRRVWFFGNNAGSGGGGAIKLQSGTHTIEESTFSSNTAVGCAALINFVGSNAVIRNSTLSGNTITGGVGGAICNQAGGILEITNSTLTNNATGGNPGGGVFIDSGSLTIRNSIIAGNTAPGGPDIFYFAGSVTSGGFNLIGDAPGDSTNTGNAITYQSTDIVDTPPLLGPLQDNGGPTLTHGFSGLSPAIDAGSAFGAGTDQRGSNRTVNYPSVANVDDGTDIGAYELLAPTAAPASISGRVLTRSGAGIRGAIVTVQGMDGGVWSVSTNTFGHYRIEGLTAGASYVVTVSSRRYVFANGPQLISLEADLTGMDFIADH